MLTELLRALIRQTLRPERERIPGAVKRAVLDRDGWRCRDCGRQLAWRQAQMGHRVAWSRGGDDSASNLYATCGPCNRHRGPHVPFAHRVKRACQWTAVCVALGAVVGIVAACRAYGVSVVAAAVAGAWEVGR